MGEPIQQTSKSYFRTLTILHLAFCIAQLMIIGISIFMVTSTGGGTNPENMSSMTALIIGAALSVSCFLASRFIYSRLLNKAIQQPGLVPKMNAYRTAFVVRCAVLESPVMICALLFMFTGEYYLLLFAGIMLVYFVTLRPTKQTTITELQLDYSDQLVLDDPDAIVSVLTRNSNNN